MIIWILKNVSQGLISQEVYVTFYGQKNIMEIVLSILTAMVNSIV